MAACQLQSRLLHDRRYMLALRKMDYLAWTLRTILPISPWSFLPTRRVPDLDSQSVVVIGCDTGMGNALVKYLCQKLHMKRVYAGCFTEQGAKELESIAFRVFPIDVRDVQSCQRAADFIRSEDPGGLFAVVNIAGAMFGGPIEWTGIDVYRQEMDLNYFGLLHVIKTFMPLLKEYSMPIQQGSRGKKPTQNSRFIAVTSTIAVMPSFPGLSGYAASKSAADTLMNCLRVEVKPFAIDVITVCPGITRTPFLSKGADQMRCAWESAPQHIKKDYGDVYATWLPSAVQFGIDWLAHDVGDTVECLVDASTGAWPKTRYFSGIDARILARPSVHVPDFVWDGGLSILNTILGQPPVQRARL